MSSINLYFEHPYFLLLLIPAIILAFIPFFKLPKHRRNSNARKLSLILHIIVLVLTTLVLTGFRVHVENSVKTKDVIFLVDESYSLETSEKQVERYLKRVFSEYDSDYRLGIVSFAKNYDYVSKLSKDTDHVLETYLKSDSKLDTSATDFAKALYFTKSIFTNPKKGRIIIISDGLQTDEDGLAACKNLVGDGVLVDCVYLPNEKWSNDVLVKSATFKETPTLNTNNKLLIDIESFDIDSAKLTVTNDGKTIFNENVSLIQENEQIEVPITFSTAKVQEVKVTIQAENDQNSKNNVYYTYANIEGADQILIVEGATGVSTKLKQLLIGNSYQCVTTSVNDLADYTLNEFGQVILMNVNYNDLPTGYDREIDQYVKNGGNLFTTGGKNTYNLGGMKDTLFDNFMPIDFTALNYRPQAFLFVMDNSSSMKQTISGSTKTKMDLAKEAAITAVNSLNNYDYFGIITFDANAKLVCEITPATKKAEIIEKINTIKVGLGTNYKPALEMARNELISFREVENKNVVFISDGNPQDTQYKSLISGMYAQDIITSTIALGDDINEGELKDMAAHGGGNYYHVRRAEELVDIMLDATSSFSKDAFVEEEKAPIIKTHGSIVNGINDLPKLNGYNRVTAKNGATTYLTIDDNPIYTYWDYFGGKVGCFMGDLSEEYSSSYFSDSQGQLLVKNIISSLTKTSGVKREMNVTVLDDNHSKVVTVRTSSGGGKNKVNGKLTLPDGTTKDIEFVLSANNTYTAVIKDCTQKGVYSLEITKKSSNKKVTQKEYFTFSYSEEFIYSDGGIDFLNDLCKVSTHGKLFQLSDALFSDVVEYDITDYNPQITLLVIALILFLFDIIVRKFKFKWPSAKNLKETKKGI